MALVKGASDNRLYNRFTGIAYLAPLGHAAAVNIEVIERSWSIVRSSDNGLSITTSNRNVAALLPSVDLIRHAHFSAGDDAQAVGVRLIGSLRDLGIVKRRFGKVLRFENLGRVPSVKETLTGASQKGGKVYTRFRRSAHAALASDCNAADLRREALLISVSRLKLIPSMSLSIAAFTSRSQCSGGIESRAFIVRA
jgi:hypothetical protein